jgi:hypothetical protein
VPATVQFPEFLPVLLPLAPGRSSDTKFQLNDEGLIARIMRTSKASPEEEDSHPSPFVLCHRI